MWMVYVSSSLPLVPLVIGASSMFSISTLAVWGVGLDILQRTRRNTAHPKRRATGMETAAVTTLELY